MITRILEHVEPKAYLDFDLFKTELDTIPAMMKQYEKGLEVGKTYDTIHIAVNGAWSASMDDSSRNLSTC